MVEKGSTSTDKENEEIEKKLCINETLSSSLSLSTSNTTSTSTFYIPSSTQNSISTSSTVLSTPPPQDVKSIRRWRRWIRKLGFVGILLEALVDVARGLGWKGWLKLAIVAGIAAVALALGIVFYNEIKTGFLDFLEWVHTIRYYGPPVLAAVYAIATVLMIPGSLLTLGAGFVFGLWLGYPTVLIGASAGLLLAFAVSRVVLRRLFVRDVVARNATFNALDRAVQRNGWKLVVLLRLSPVVPFNVVNYLFGMTSVVWWHYALCSIVGIMPGTLLFCYLGSSARTIGDLLTGADTGSTLYQVFFWTGLAFAILSVVAITYVSRQAVMQMMRESESAATTNERGAAAAAASEESPTSSVAEPELPEKKYPHPVLPVVSNDSTFIQSSAEVEPLLG